MTDIMRRIDEIVRADKWTPYRGWHDDHRDVDGTALYLPAIQQVRSEYAKFMKVCMAQPRTKALLLGIGNCMAPVEALEAVYDIVHAVDVKNFGGHLSGDTRSLHVRGWLHDHGPYDMLFIDAGHGLDDVRQDYLNYKDAVKPGGIIAFHDSLPREGYPEVKVHEFLKTLDGVHSIGKEVGIAWLQR